MPEAIESPPSGAAKSFHARLETRYRRGAPLRREFLKVDMNGSSSLARLMSSSGGGGGGRGGQVRLALLLSAIWVAAAPPHDATRPARWWAELAGLPDPSVSGARRVLNAMQELHDRSYLVMERGQRGQPPTIRLLRETGDRAQYRLPYTDPEPNYFRIPHQLWTTGLIGRLSGRGLALYLCFLSHHHHGATDGIWFSRQGFRNLHGLGESTRLKGITELIDAGVLSVQERSIDAGGSTEYRTYRRRLFTIEPPYTPPPSATAPRYDVSWNASSWESSFADSPIPPALIDNTWPPPDAPRP